MGIRMTEANRHKPGSDADYRRSHLTRGDRYDSVLAAAPFDAYIRAETKKWGTLIREYGIKID